MNIIIWIDEWPGWNDYAGGTTLAQRIINAAVEATPVRRVTIIVSKKWATGISGKQPLFVLPSSASGISPPVTLTWEDGPPETQLLRVFRLCDFDRALILGKAYIYIWPFMIQEIFEGKTNKEYGLQETTWKEILDRTESKEINYCRYKYDPLTLQYVYAEMTAGAAWDDILTELEGNGKQEPIPS